MKRHSAAACPDLVHVTRSTLRHCNNVAYTPKSVKLFVGIDSCRIHMHDQLQADIILL